MNLKKKLPKIALNESFDYPQQNQTIIKTNKIYPTLLNVYTKNIHKFT